jgi:hypothetical protein
LAKNNRAFKSAKRNKELARQKKREEKRKRRLEREQSPLPADGTTAEPGLETPVPDVPESQ